MYALSTSTVPSSAMNEIGGMEWMEGGRVVDYM